MEVDKKKFKIGKSVRIKKDITRTTQLFSADRIMRDMAGSKTTYRIESVGSDRIYIKGYMWAPEDILDDDIEPLAPKKTGFLFDPKELL